MRWRAGTGWLLLAALAVAVPALSAQQEVAPAPMRVAFTIKGVRQLGPAYAGQPVTLEVEVRNTGQTECGVCQVRVIGGGEMASQALPRLRAGETAKVIVGGMAFARPGKYPLSLGIEAPRNLVAFGGRKPNASFELTVLEGGPVKRGSAR